MSVDVTYEPDHTPNARVTVTIALDETGAVAPPIALPIGTWDVIWIPLEGKEVANLELPVNLPPGLTVVDQPQPGHEQNHWTARFVNQSAQLSAFPYHVTPKNGQELKTFRKDPTIIVTPDPIGPPTV